ncbi:MAG: ribose-5-phosphate isomerase [Bifidobacteriaceae bacterium]|nr:ribose-5-phosphate isomerase [Bifidobacteriaceae bacterium]
MRIHVGSDHAGYELKAELLRHLGESGFDTRDHGAAAFDATDDYPAICFDVAEAVVREKLSLGVVIGGSGNGEQIAANKVIGTRAALAWSVETAKLARWHNDANIVAIGARQHTVEEALAIVDAFLAEGFSGDRRHERRVEQIASYEDRRASGGFVGQRAKSTWVD